ncbi:carboxypeptidase-like regulatory domain-containing protein [Sporohalobacter salinus]|uniref:carboxypeptidase-like regulatory domain-containing protein n=1 Tax=Sporohalobacter salinus TaxID=1494606 RepID=UPI001961D0DD|nr:carboxypeptidase-like regulatory domain-containing protein [Sporohalobacter salinus]MBM7623712.1 hypothetical protein [Sporohalobacter salinus]
MALTFSLQGFSYANGKIEIDTPPDNTIEIKYRLKKPIISSVNTSGKVKIDTPPNNTIEVEYKLRKNIVSSAITNANINFSSEKLSLLGSTITNSSINSFVNSSYGVISGIVTKDNKVINNAKLYLINTTDDNLEDITTTNESGEYQFDNLNINKEYHVVVQYAKNGDKYNAESLPFVKPVV